ncbi:hypothetical protein CBL_07527 [Carabus blaptoides fortunei]
MFQRDRSKSTQIDIIQGTQNDTHIRPDKRDMDLLGVRVPLYRFHPNHTRHEMNVKHGDIVHRESAVPLSAMAIISVSYSRSICPTLSPAHSSVRRIAAMTIFEQKQEMEWGTTKRVAKFTQFHGLLAQKNESNLTLLLPAATSIKPRVRFTSHKSTTRTIAWSQHRIAASAWTPSRPLVKLHGAEHYTVTLNWASSLQTKIQQEQTGIAPNKPAALLSQPPEWGNFTFPFSILISRI